MSEVYIIDAIRTPIGALGGVLASVRADDLAALVIKAIVERNNLDPSLVEEVYFGCANQAGEDNRNVARMASLLAGLPVEVPAVTFNRLCASGLNAVNQAARAIKAGEGDVFIAGGVENMSRAPYSAPKAEKGFSFGNLTMWDTALGWRYPNPRMQEMYGTEQMGETAENIAAMKPEITREMQDAFSVRSHQNAIAAIDSGKFAQEILPVQIPQRKGEALVVDTDERPRRDTTLETLAKLRPAFRKEGGTVTAGNSSGLNDGAAALLLMNAEKAKALGLKPMARLVTSAAGGVPPRIMGLGPVPATTKVLKRAGLKLADIGLVELNEAFAIQSLAVMQELEMDPEIVNVNGGAIALGHPLGCSGARILTTLLYEMKRRSMDHKQPFFGLATLCVGVGQGEATLVEWVG
ncbi:MAG: beta-ketoadipyl CoA thiolase [Chloroflexi bacterium GWB2_49_20]|nr:MAG: beta-ketoadipyl CoA thiolase [Chloroflexi bacterium GWB2_49_20]OGN79474.1 MAG: beta-ketoadipyl CoA thiolase [Chloroflexi bacterium GWC2_49_37]OGN84603.1 MAG: beta-ketoadipyl CoA thiolase [Chloroflexi bacterium GWD2_49_16]HCC79287.1 3-oxoadipyl-CoA thiolase [Anaerolineae bacterium]HCM97227.1 3-oxoadipyl-CoA thiolase [Anaerolineae bacterium]